MMSPFPFTNDQEISMKNQLVLSAVVAAIAVFSQGAFAQASMPSRAEVKAEAKTGALAPAGEGPGAMAGSKNTNGKSTKTRMERKAETRTAKATGNLKPAGDGNEKETSDDTRAKPTVNSRADRKATTKALNKSGGLEPAGEVAQPIGDPKKK
jgi:hypothetical protein